MLTLPAAVTVLITPITRSPAFVETLPAAAWYYLIYSFLIFALNERKMRNA